MILWVSQYQPSQSIIITLAFLQNRSNSSNSIVLNTTYPPVYEAKNIGNLVDPNKTSRDVGSGKSLDSPVPCWDKSSETTTNRWPVWQNQKGKLVVQLEMRTSPSEACSTAETAGAPPPPRDDTLWGPGDCATGSRWTYRWPLVGASSGPGLI